MKSHLVSLLAGLVLIPLFSHAAQTADARLYCESLRFQQAQFGEYTLDLTTVGGAPNGELTPVTGPYTHGSFFVLEDPFFGAIDGEIYFSTPPRADANGNGFDDFFEVVQGVPTMTAAGEFFTAFGSQGTVTARWNRSAGSKDGTCRLTLVDDSFGDLGTYTHPFELIEYTGPLAYTPGSNKVTGKVNLTQTGHEGSRLTGPVELVKVAADPANQLDLQPGGWTNELVQVMKFGLSFIDRDSLLQTNYYGSIEFDNDADPSTFQPYAFWVLSIDDLNDADSDGIPDLSDEAVSTPPQAPFLSLQIGSTNLLLTIHGEVGRVHEILSAGAVTGTVWEAGQTVILTNDSQVISLPLPTAATFWRARAH